MKLYVLRCIEGEWEPWYDTMDGIIVHAESELQARGLASTQAGDEGAEVWLDPSKTSCRELTPDPKPGVELRSFNAA